MNFAITGILFLALAGCVTQAPKINLMSEIKTPSYAIFLRIDKEWNQDIFIFDEEMYIIAYKYNRFEERKVFLVQRNLSAINFVYWGQHFAKKTQSHLPPGSTTLVIEFDKSGNLKSSSFFDAGEFNSEQSKYSRLVTTWCSHGKRVLFSDESLYKLINSSNQ